MSRINKLTTSFTNITSALDKTKNQDEYNIYVSMLDEEDLECLKYVQLRQYNNRQQLPSPTDTDESKPENKKRGRNTKKKVAEDDVVMSEPTTSEDPTLPPSPASLEYASSFRTSRSAHS